MAQQSFNSLFHNKTLRNALSSFCFPSNIEERHQKILPWVKTLASGTLDEVKETSLHGDFLKDVFQSALGYRSVITGEGQSWELHAEQTISDGGGSADGALGFFTATEGKQGGVKLQGQVVAPIELKGSKNDLDRAAPGRKESAVDQGWRYANYTADCRWVLVSNYREIRLYQTSKTPAYYERFRLEELAHPEAFKRFYFVLCRENFLPPQNDPKGRSRTDQLLALSSEAEEEITRELYEEYKQVRLNLAKHFRATGPEELPDRDAVLIEKAQKTLDRVLFIAFCEDRGLLPRNTLKNAHDHKDLYSPRLIWENYKAVFRAVDQGNADLAIPGYNGGLFKLDSLLDEQLQVPDVLCTQLNRLTRFDFDSEVSVNILGHIFEQSVTDLEELRALSAGEAYDQKKGRRKTQGVYYTPAFITQYIVGVALGGYLERKERALWAEIGIDQIQARATRKRREAEIQFWERYRDEVLLRTRVVDPACGSGAFLIAAFDFLNRQYERVNEQLAALQLADDGSEYVGQRSLFDLNKTILNQNLYGVDLSPESVEITKLSLWLKTAEHGKPLTYLDDNIKVGNSLISDSAYDPRAFVWEVAFSDVFADGGFDVVIGNPPYVRQELLSPFKSHLQQHYASYNGVADLYIYFYEKGLNILKDNGLLSYIVTNKWFRAGYGEPLRKFFSEISTFEEIIDFGHAPIFEDVDVFPCIVLVKKLPEESCLSPKDSSVKVCSISRERLSDINLPQYVNQNFHEIPWSRFNNTSWSLEPLSVDILMEKIKKSAIRLKDFLGIKPYRGLLTGFNEAFIIDGELRKRLIEADFKVEEVIKPFLRGQDVKRWSPEWRDDLWMIVVKSSGDYTWPWSGQDAESAEEIFSQTFPSLYKHLVVFKDKLQARYDKGRYWWELRACAYYDLFPMPKLIYQEIQFHPAYCYDTEGYVTNNKSFILSSADLYGLAVLNSPLAWWHNWRYLPHMKDEALTPKGELIESFPIASPTDKIRAAIEPAVQNLIEITKANQDNNHEVLDWLRLEHGIDKPGNSLSNFATLRLDDFIKEVKKRRPKAAGGLGPKALKELKDVYGDYALPSQERRSEALVLEQRLSGLVNQAYGLTPEEIDLMWKTAPPRMPIPNPLTSAKE